MTEIKFSKKEQWMIFLVVNITLLFVLLVFPLYKHLVENVIPTQCGMVRFLHMYCPACGGTRAFSAMLHFDIVSSILYNPVVVVGVVIFVKYEITMIKYLVKGVERPLMINIKVVTVLLILWGVYFIARNVLLFFGIDLIGDIIR